MNNYTEKYLELSFYKELLESMDDEELVDEVMNLGYNEEVDEVIAGFWEGDDLSNKDREFLRNFYILRNVR